MRSSYLKEIIGREGAGWEILAVMRIQGHFCCMRSKHGYRGSHNDFLGGLNDSKVSSYNGFKVSVFLGHRSSCCPQYTMGQWFALFFYPLPFHIKKRIWSLGWPRSAGFIKISFMRASLVAQWIRMHLPMQETQVPSLVWEDSTRATKP